LIPSAASHTILKTNKNYAQLFADLNKAKASGSAVLVTEDKSDQIQAVHPPPRALPKAGGSVPAIFASTTRQTLTMDQATSMFNSVVASTCDPNNVSNDCVSFMYPDDGCWGRASWMSWQFAKQGIHVDKAWNYGHLKANTANNPQCFVQWGYHVAPAVDVTQADGTVQKMVIDPSMFNQPVLATAWQAAQTDQAAFMEFKDATVYLPTHLTHLPQDSTDSDWSQTMGVIATYRARLYNRVLSNGPPPYSSCPGADSAPGQPQATQAQS